MCEGSVDIQPLTPLTLTKEEASAALNVPVDTVLNLTRTGQLASIVVGKHKRWLLDDLREYVEKQRTGPACLSNVG